MRKFLTAEWRDLVMANYQIDPAILADRVPYGTELDLHEDRCFVSLVGFMFLNTRVVGLPIPYHVNFEEVNLRFYVKREMPDEVRRGVCFIKEIVPRRAICYVARTFYGEPYEAWRMSNERSDGGTMYGWSRGEDHHSLSVTTSANLGVPASGSHGEFIIEHYWGYTKRGPVRTDEYKVEHPKWELRNVESHNIAVDFGGVYGDVYGFLSDVEPDSVLFGEGSEIAVYKGSRVRH